MNFCKDCVHFIERLGDVQSSKCDAPQTMDFRDPITGEAAVKHCIAQRLANTGGKTCGPEGDWFQPREPEKAAA